MKKLNKYILLLIIIISLHVLVLIKSNFFPYPELVIYPYLTNIGLIPYKEIFDQHFPGFMFFPLNIGTLGVDTPLELKAVHLLVVTFIHIFLYRISKEVLKSKRIAIFLNILLLIFHLFLEGYALWIDSFLPLLYLPAFYLLNKTLTKKSAFVLGILVGATVLLKQVAIPLAIFITLYIFIKRRKENIPEFALGALIPASLLLLFVLRNNILEDFIFWAGTFNITTYAQMGRKYATFRQLLAVGVIFMPSLMVSMYGIISKKRLLVLLSAFFIANLLFAYARFDYVHLQPALPFALLLLGYFFKHVPKSFSTKLFILYLLPVLWVSSKFYMNNMGDEVKFFGKNEYLVADKIKNFTAEDDPIFMFGTLPHMYALTNTRPSGNVFVFHFPWFMVEAEERILSGLTKEPPKVVVKQDSAIMDGENLYSYMPNINKYVLENYEKIEEVEDIEILIPRKNP